VKELPVVDKIYREFKDKGLVVLAINSSEGVEAIREFLKDKGYTFKVLIDEDLDAANKYEALGIPQTYVINRERTIVAHLTGYNTKSESELRTAIENALSGIEQSTKPSNSSDDNLFVVTPENIAQPESSLRVVQVASKLLHHLAIKKVKPVYTLQAKKKGIQGEVKVEVTFSETGEVIAAKVVSGPELLHEACLSAVRKWKFMPVEISGSPVKVNGILIFNLSLKKRLR
jgi:TonB family protein